MTAEGKKNLQRDLIGLIGVILLVYGADTLATSFWSAEAYQTAGSTNIMASAAAAIVGIALIIIWATMRARK